MKPNLVFLGAAVAALSPSSSEAFAPLLPNNNAARPLSTTSLSMSRNGGNIDGDNGKTFAASALVAAYLLTTVVNPPDVAFAATDYHPNYPSSSSSSSSFVDSSSIVVSARSGGRAGGRAMPRSMPSRPPSSSSSTTTVINRKTIIAAPPVVIGGGGYGYGGYGGYYDPTPGLALNLGFSAVNAIGNGIRESRQNEMIYQERAELGAAREREAEMAARIRQLELMQAQQAGGGQVAQPQIIIAQPPVMQAAQ
ncbi:hypothetical protein ACHAXA_004375 [Cyclostephanos tholiformis]|uniref:Uncharacterized protein n=1 Tax=Cyclostephanos tholiformis TaxID=382380 RepID=A0ABD3R983_9STRA